MNHILLSEIAVDAGTQVRAAISEQVVADYAERMSEGVTFPPVVLFHDGNAYYLADGFHRVMASQRVGFTDIDADVRPGTQTDALWFALGANKVNGHRMTTADKTRAVLLALQMWPDKMQRQIAEQVGCSESLVSKVAEDIAKNTSGEPVLRGRELATKRKRDAIKEMVLAGEQSIDIKRKLNAHAQAIADVRRELGLSTIDYSRTAVKARRAQMRDMAAQGHTSLQIATAVGMSVDGCRNTLKREGINVPADKVTRGTHRPDSNRIMGRIVMDAENLTEGVNLIEFADLDRARLPEWIDSLIHSRRALDSFIKRLTKEKANDGEAA